MERRAYLQTMFACLPDQRVIRTQQRITSIIENDEEISVFLANGTVERGDIVVGCDGVNSIVRQAMWANANGTMPVHKVSAEKESEPYVPFGLSCSNCPQLYRRRIAVF